MGDGANYHGGLSWAPNPAYGSLIFSEESIELVDPRGLRKQTVLKVGVAAIDFVEITSQQVAKSRVGAVLAFGVLGGLAAKGGGDRGALLLHMKNGDTAYFTLEGYSEIQLMGKMSPWLRSLNIPIGPRAPGGGLVSVADELAKLAVLRDSGVLTEDEFATQKAKLLS